MQLAIIEIDYHPEVLRNLCRILQQQTIYQVGIYTTPKIWKQVGLNAFEQAPFQIYLSEENQSIPDFIRSYLPQINQADILLFNTLASHFKFFSEIDFEPKTILRVHNTNAYFSPKTSFKPKWEPFFLWKDSSHFVRKILGEREAYYRAKFLEKTDFFSFPAQTVEDYAIAHKLVDAKRVLQPQIPLIFTQSGALTQVLPTAPISIAVLGTIDQRRRDYNALYKAFEILVPSLKHPTILRLLGKPNGRYGEMICERFKQLDSENFQVSYFDGFVTQNLFDQLVGESHFLVIPLIKEARYTIYTELYGHTKISGNINDMIYYAKPAIVPETYPLEADLEQLVGRYQSVEYLATLILTWIEETTYKKKNKNTALAAYELPQVQAQVLRAFEQCLDRPIRMKNKIKQ